MGRTDGWVDGWMDGRDGVSGCMWEDEDKGCMNEGKVRDMGWRTMCVSVCVVCVHIELDGAGWPIRTFNLFVLL